MFMFSMHGSNDNMKSLCLIVIFAIVKAESVSINKCCPLGQNFQLVEDEMKCASSDPNLKFGSDLKSHKFKFNYGVMPCKEEGQLRYVFPGNFVLLDDGTLQETSGKNDTYSKKAYCMENIRANYTVAFACPCIERLCMWKCCDFGHHLIVTTDKDDEVDSIYCENQTDSKEWHHSDLKGEKITKKDEILIGYGHKECDKQRLFVEGDYTLYKDGSIWTELNGWVESGEFCGEFRILNNGTRKVAILACLGPPLERDSLVFGSFSIFGALLLILTTAIQLMMPDAPWLSTRMLVMHLASLIMAYVDLVFIKLISFRISSVPCSVVGFVMQFSFLASFFWLNVMCVDMSWTFSGIRPPSGSRKERERRKFIWYSLYAWGGASALTLAAIIVEFVPGVPEKSPYKPNFGVISCWFKENEALWLYFYGPMGILLLSNLGLFVYTSFRIILLKRGTGALRQAESAQHGSRRNKQRFVLYAKLFLLMGVTWLTEIISWIVGTEGSNALNYLWYITDAINLLRAVFIFIIFCWKPRVWSNIKKKFPCTKRCEEFFIRTCCRREPTPDAQEEQKTSSTNGGQKDTSENGVEMENK